MYWLSSTQSQRAAWRLWLIFVVVVTCCVIVAPGYRSVTTAYRAGAERWLAGETLYDNTGTGFIYLPHAALTFVPIAQLPLPLGEMLWRWINMGLLAMGVFRLVRLAGGDGRVLLITSIVTVLLSLSVARNGQSTLPLIGLLLLAAADISDERWWRATWLLVIAFAIKPLAIVLLLLALALNRPLWWRLPIGLVVMVLAPFAMQRPSYVVDQYVACTVMLRTVFEKGQSGYWPQLFGMLKVAGWDIPSFAQQLLRMLAALATLGGCWWGTRHLSAARAAIYLYSFSACYLMLFNSRTELNTYAMVGPTYGLAFAEAWLELRNRRAAGCLVLMIVGTLFSSELGAILTSRDRAIWLSPLLCLGLTTYLIVRLAHESRSSTHRSGLAPMGRPTL